MSLFILLLLVILAVHVKSHSLQERNVLIVNCHLVYIIYIRLDS